MYKCPKCIIMRDFDGKSTDPAYCSRKSHTRCFSGTGTKCGWSSCGEDKSKHLGKSLICPDGYRYCCNCLQRDGYSPTVCPQCRQRTMIPAGGLSPAVIAAQPATDSRGAAMGSASALNRPGKWKYMISYVQRDSSAEAHALSQMLGPKDCWFDFRMEDKSEAAMEEGVAKSDCFLCLLSPGYMESPYCRKEALWAQKYGCRIVSAYASRFNVGSILGMAPPELKWLCQIDSKKLDLSDAQLFEVGVSKIKRAAGES